MVKVKETFKTFYKGNSATIPAGVIYTEDAEIVINNPGRFEKIDELEVQLLIEEPVEVDVSMVDEPVEERKPARKTRKKKTT